MIRASLLRLATVGVLALCARAETLEEKHKAKLDKPFAKAVPWVLDYDAARKQAKASGKPIFAYFSRSFRP